MLQVRHDDLRESVSKLGEQLEGCAAFLQQETPGHAESVRASAKALRDEAILLEENLKVGGADNDGH